MKMRYKIQTAAPFGWGDLKTSFDDGKTYIVEEFKTRKDALDEMQDIVRMTDSNRSDYRVVTLKTKQDQDLYI